MNNPRNLQVTKEGAIYSIPTFKVTNDGILDGGGIDIKFCKGNKEDESVFRQQGVFTETLLQVVLQYLQSVNVGEMASRDTSLAITHIEDALFRIGKRAEDRKLRGVQATYNKQKNNLIEKADKVITISAFFVLIFFKLTVATFRYVTTYITTSLNLSITVRIIVNQFFNKSKVMSVTITSFP